MSGPTREEIKAVLELSSEAQVALLYEFGPGWHIAADGLALPLTDEPNPFRASFAWIPVDTAEILAVVRARTGLLVQLEAHPEEPHWLVWVPDGDEDWNFTGATARLAAVRLLAAVYR